MRNGSQIAIFGYLRIFHVCSEQLSIIWDDWHVIITFAYILGRFPEHWGGSSYCVLSWAWREQNEAGKQNIQKLGLDDSFKDQCRLCLGCWAGWRGGWAVWCVYLRQTWRIPLLFLSSLTGLVFTVFSRGRKLTRGCGGRPLPCTSPLRKKFSSPPLCPEPTWHDGPRAGTPRKLLFLS